MTRREDRAFKSPDSPLELRALLHVDLHRQRRADLAHALKRRLLRRYDGLNLARSEIIQQMRLIDRPLRVPNIGQLAPGLDDSLGRSAGLHQLASPVGRLPARDRKSTRLNSSH